MPVLAGVKKTLFGVNVIGYIPDPYFGITLPKDINTGGTIQCTNSNSDYMSRKPVVFGSNSQGGCTLRLTKNDFNSCTALRKRIFQLQTLTASKVDHVGRFGNSSASNIYDWIKIIDPGAGLANGQGQLTDPTDACSNLLTSFDVQFLYTSYGISSNPQMAIVGARYSYTSGSFSWRCLNQDDCVDPNLYKGQMENPANIGQTSRPYSIRSSVSFVKVATIGTNLYTPPLPRIYPVLPNDVWYPFNIPTGTKHVGY
jgi:hypothetical protein